MGAYMKLGDIKGGVLQENHKDWIMINSWSISAARPVVSDQGSEESRHRGESQVGEISVSKVIDKSTVYIVQDLLKGTVQKEAMIEMTTTEGDKKVKTYFTLKMTDVRITNHSLSGAGDEGSLASESFSLNPTAVTWTYHESNPLAKEDKPHTVGYNLDTIVVEDKK